MSGNDDDLLRMFAALQITDDVVAGLVSQLLWREGEVHPNFPFCGEMRDQFGILGGHRAGRDSGWKAPASMRQAGGGIFQPTDPGSGRAQVSWRPPARFPV